MFNFDTRYVNFYTALPPLYLTISMKTWSTFLPYKLDVFLLVGKGK